jgi:MSHA biogenesis protein MshP
MKRAQKGFTLIAAIFLLVVVASLVIYIANIRVVQQTTLLYGVQGARASQAARSGIEWGIHRSIVVGSCAASTSFTDAAFAGFTIQVECDRTTHVEGGVTFDTFSLKSIASSGTFGTLDYVQRQIQATVSLDPP